MPSETLLQHQEALNRIENKLDSITHHQHQLSLLVAKNEERDKASQKALDFFLTSQWPKVIEKVERHQIGISTLEVEIARIKTKILVWGSFLVGIIVLSIPFIEVILAPSE